MTRRSGRVGFRLAFKKMQFSRLPGVRESGSLRHASACTSDAVRQGAGGTDRAQQPAARGGGSSLSVAAATPEEPRQPRAPRQPQDAGGGPRRGSPSVADGTGVAARRRLGSRRPPRLGGSIGSPGRARPSVDAALPSPPRRPSVDAPPSPPPPADRAVGGAPADLDARITRRLGELAAARSPSTSPQHKRRPAAPPSPTAKDLVARIERATRERAAAAAAASPPRRRRSLDAAPPSPPRPPPPAAPPAPAPAPARDPTAIARPLLDALTHLEAAKPASPSLLGALWSGFDAAAPPPAPPDPRAPSPPKSLASGGRVGALEAPESLLQFDAHRGRRTSRRRRSSTRDAAAAAPVATLPEPVGGLDDDASDVERAAAEDELRGSSGIRPQPQPEACRRTVVLGAETSDIGVTSQRK